MLQWVQRTENAYTAPAHGHGVYVLVWHHHASYRGRWELWLYTGAARELFAVTCGVRNAREECESAAERYHNATPNEREAWHEEGEIGASEEVEEGEPFPYLPAEAETAIRLYLAERRERWEREYEGLEAKRQERKGGA